MKKYFKLFLKLIITGLISLSFSCNKYLDVQLPITRIAGAASFSTDATTSAVVTGLLSQMSTSPFITGSGSVGYTTAAYSDETQNLDISDPIKSFYTNSLNASANIGTGSWTAIYRLLYQTNVAIENIQANNGKLTNGNQWLGECYFLRAYSYLLLTDLYGDVPLSLTSDVEVNRKLGNTPRTTIYNQIVKDLKLSQELLSVDYKDSYSAITLDRTRPNKLAATALLARVYLYEKDWTNAELQASQVIGTATYTLEPLSNVFLKAAKESIFSFATLTGVTTPGTDYKIYNNGMPAIIPPGTVLYQAYQVKVALTNSLVNNFENGDGRFSNWIRKVTVPAAGNLPATDYYFPNKYKSPVVGTEYSVVLRLAEQFLIRAEARAQLNNITGGKDDLNIIRTRAGLNGTTSNDKDGLINAILKERRSELFTEFGHRFFDLKRTETIDAVMNLYAPSKGATWSSFKQFWPRPSQDIQLNPEIKQTPGY